MTENHMPWLAVSPREAQAFDTVDDALAAIAQSTQQRFGEADSSDFEALAGEA